MRRRGRRLVASAAFIYTSVTVIVWLLADRFLFPREPASYADGPDIVKLSTRDGARISAVHLVRPDAPFTVLFSHGNAEDLGDLRPELERVRASGFSVLAYDYRGYGTSEGRPSERAIYQDVDAAFALLRSKGVPSRRVLVYGRSIGGGPSVDLAAREDVGGLILESAFTSAFRVVTRVRLFPFDAFDNLAKLPRVKAPVLVMHGTADRVVPIRHGRALFDVARTEKRALWVEGAGHDNLPWMAGDAYGKALQEIAALAAARGR